LEHGFEEFEGNTILRRAASSAVICHCTFTNVGDDDIRVAPGSLAATIGNIFTDDTTDQTPAPAAIEKPTMRKPESVSGR